MPIVLRYHTGSSRLFKHFFSEKIKTPQEQEQEQEQVQKEPETKYQQILHVGEFSMKSDGSASRKLLHSFVSNARRMTSGGRNMTTSLCVKEHDEKCYLFNSD